MGEHVASGAAVPSVAVSRVVSLSHEALKLLRVTIASVKWFASKKSLRFQAMRGLLSQSDDTYKTAEMTDVRLDVNTIVGYFEKQLIGLRNPIINYIFTNYFP